MVKYVTLFKNILYFMHVVYMFYLPPYQIARTNIQKFVISRRKSPEV